MRAPEKLALLPERLPEQAAIEAWLADMAAYQALRAQAEALQSFIRQNCQ